MQQENLTRQQTTQRAFLGAALVINPFEGASVLMIFYGVALIVDGIENFISYACVKKHIKKDYPIESWFIDNDNNNFLN